MEPRYLVHADLSIRVDLGLNDLFGDFGDLHLLLSAQCHMITLSGRGSVNYWDDCDKFLPVDFRYCKRRCLNCDEPPWPLLPLPASRSSQTKRERQYTLRSDINLSFAPLMLPKHPIIPGESRLFCGLPEGLGGSLGSQLLDTSVFGLVKAWGFGGAVWGDIIFVSPPNGASSFHSCFGDSQWVAASIVEGARADETIQQ